MGMRSWITRPLKAILAARGYSVTRTSEVDRGRMGDAIASIARRNQRVRTVIDIGASDGRWSALMARHFPSCEYLLVEAQPVHEASLEQFCRVHPRARYVLAAAGDAVGHINFHAGSPMGGQASHTPHESHNIVVPMTTIDAEVHSRQLEGPYLLKLDTHGFEAPILRGAAETLKATEAIVMECYNFKIAPEGLLFFEMCEHMKASGFRCMDLVDPLYRRSDDVLYQVDLVFVRSDRPEFALLEYDD